MTGWTSTWGGRAAQLLDELEDRAEIHDLYDQFGAGVYGQLVDSDPSEVMEFLRVLGPRPRAVLELAAGDGRLTIPMVAAGHTVTAVDMSESMVERLRRRTAELPTALSRRCSPVLANMCSYRSDRPVDDVVLGATSICLLDRTEREQLLSCAAEHLGPEGRLLVTVPTDRNAADTDIHEFFELDDGSEYELSEHRPVGASQREITIAPVDRSGERVIVLHSVIGIVTPQIIEKEAQAVGLVLDRATPIVLGPSLPAVTLLSLVHR